MMELRPSPAFYRFAGVCSVVSAFTTLVLIFGSRLYDAPGSLDEAVAMRHEPAYLFRLWIYLLHPMFVFTAALGVALYKLRDDAGSALLGLFAFFAWAICEAVQQGFALATLNLAWRSGYENAVDAATRESYRTLLLGFEGIWDAFYLVILMAFILGNLAFGIATRRGRGLERWASIAYFAAVILSIGTWLANFADMRVMSDATGWAYPLLQPAARVLFGLWLFQIARGVAQPISSTVGAQA